LVTELNKRNFCEEGEIFCGEIFFCLNIKLEITLESFVVVIESERDRRKSCINVVLCFEPVDEFVKCDHSVEARAVFN